MPKIEHYICWVIHFLIKIRHWILTYIFATFLWREALCTDKKKSCKNSHDLSREKSYGTSTREKSSDLPKIVKLKITFLHIWKNCKVPTK